MRREVVNLSMEKIDNILNILDKQDKKVITAFYLAIFGLLLFIAVALTLPWI